MMSAKEPHLNLPLNLPSQEFMRRYIRERRREEEKSHLSVLTRGQVETAVGMAPLLEKADKAQPALPAPCWNGSIMYICSPYSVTTQLLQGMHLQLLR